MSANIFIFTSVVFKQVVMFGIQCNVYKQLFFKCQLSNVEGCVRSSNGNDIKTKAERSFDLDFVFNIEAKQTCLFQNEAKRTLLILHLRKIEAKRILFIPQIWSGANSVYSTNWKDWSEVKSAYSTNSNDRSGANSVYSQIGKIEAKSVYSTNSKDRSAATQLIPEIGKIEAKKRTGSK